MEDNADRWNENFIRTIKNRTDILHSTFVNFEPPMTANILANKLPSICQVLTRHLHVKKKRNSDLLPSKSTAKHSEENPSNNRLKTYDCDQIPALSIISSIKPSQIRIKKCVTRKITRNRLTTE